MDKFFYFYIEANIVCIIISSILIFREITNIDKQLRKIEFLKTIFIYVVFYFVDIIWAFFQIYKDNFTYFSNSIIYILRLCVFTYGSYQWFFYSEVAQGESEIYNLKNRIKWAVPVVTGFLIFLIYTILIMCKHEEKLEISYVYYIHLFMIFIAFGYEVASSIKSLHRAYGNKKHISWGWFIYMGISPIIFSSFMVLQIIFLNVPIFCFLNTIMMLCYYLKGIDSIISVDPLTKLNNRNQLKKYFHQLPHENGFTNYILVIDIDKFKYINDKYGHIEGDKALVIAANTFEEVCKNYPYHYFISRYGGDEFVIIVQAFMEKEVIELKKSLNLKLSFNAKKNNAPYKLCISVGYTIINTSLYSLEESLALADKKMYLEKERKYGKLPKVNI